MQVDFLKVQQSMRRQRFFRFLSEQDATSWLSVLCGFAREIKFATRYMLTLQKNVTSIGTLTSRHKPWKMATGI